MLRELAVGACEEISTSVSSALMPVTVQQNLHLEGLVLRCPRASSAMRPAL